MRAAAFTNPYVAGRPVALGLAKLLVLLIAHLPATAVAAPTALHAIWAKHVDDGKEAEDPELWLYLGVSVVLVLAGGAFAGLTIALMGQVSWPRCIIHINRS